MEFSILYFFQSLHTPFLDRVVPAFSALGNKGLIFILLGVTLLFFKKTRGAGLSILITLAIGFLIGNGLLKHLFMRQRPCWIDQTVPLLVAVPKDYSFPSGHSLAAFETAVCIFYANRRWGIAALVFAALMALSRLYLFVHFPTDVLSGMALGVFLAWNVSRIVEKYKICDILRLKNKKAE